MTTNADELVGAGTAIAGQIVPHPLKGIVNSNDDPLACALCSVHTDSTSCGRIGNLLACCGKEICLSCGEHRQYDEVFFFCPFGCPPGSSKVWLKALKRHAKKGRPWAQSMLGMLYVLGDVVRPSVSEATRLIDMAAKNGSPQAMEMMGQFYLKGNGLIAADLSKARHNFDAALSLVPGSDGCRNGLLEVSTQHLKKNDEGSTAAAKSILLSICGFPPKDPKVFRHSDAMFFLGSIFQNEKDFARASILHTESFATCTTCSTIEKADVAFELTRCSMAQGLVAQSSFWFGKIKLSMISTHRRRDVIERYLSQRAFLRQLRDTCGACGAEFEGKDRKYCGGCRTFCYCSRECQKMHWNRKAIGHREDCLGLNDLKMKLKDAKKNSDKYGK